MTWLEQTVLLQPACYQLQEFLFCQQGNAFKTAFYNTFDLAVLFTLLPVCGYLCLKQEELELGCFGAAQTHLELSNV